MAFSSAVPDRSGHKFPNVGIEDLPNWIPVYEKPAFTPQKKLRVVLIGAGFAGLTVAHKLKYQYPEVNKYLDFTIYEKNEDIGGTWFENRYPGVCCDVPCHMYTFHFEPNPDWTRYLASGEEVLQYMKRTTKKYGLDEKIQFQSNLVSAYWNEKTAKWQLKVQQKDRLIEEETDILISGSGILNNWKWPEIEGLKSFKGKLLHSAAWDSSFDWADKNVAIIGNGSSGIQIVPQIQKTAKKAVNFIRSPTWIVPVFGSMNATGENFHYTEEEKKKFREHPEEYLKYRKALEAEVSKFLRVNIADSPESKAFDGLARQVMTQKLKDPELREKMFPKWTFGCRRITPGIGYLEALQEKNCRVEFFEPKFRVTETGIQNGKNNVEDFDAIICATGFDVSFRPFWDMQGRNGARLEKSWAEHPEAYFAACTSDHPNYFFINGPNCCIANGSFLAAIDFNSDYIVRWIRKIARENIRSVCIREKALGDYNVYMQEFLKRTVWASSCRSWYKNGRDEGKITAVYGGSLLHYKDLLAEIRGEDFEIEYRLGNRFSYMGNGFTQLEVDDGDLAYYIQ